MTTTEPISPEGPLVVLSRRSSFLVHDPQALSYSADPPSVEDLVKRFQEEKLLQQELFPTEPSPIPTTVVTTNTLSHPTYPSHPPATPDVPTTGFTPVDSATAYPPEVNTTTYPPENNCLSPSASSLWVVPVPGDQPLQSTPTTNPWDPPAPADLTEVVQYMDNGKPESYKDCSEAHLLSESESEGDAGDKKDDGGGGSDCDSDVDLMKKMIRQRDKVKPPEAVPANEEDDEDEDDYTVHFVHHGKKNGK